MKQKWYYYVVFVTLVVIVGIYYIHSNDSVTVDVIDDTYNGQEASSVSIEDTNDEQTAEVPTKTICVHICGAVANEGVYTVEEGTRVHEVLEQAGGLTEDAATDYVNLARVVRDEEQITFPTKDQLESGQFQVDDMDQGLVNINTASLEKLMTLSGIGESRAKLIMAYREEHGGFETIEDIMKVSGIKEGSFKKIKDSIIVK